jgi:hypothetical protein
MGQRPFDETSLSTPVSPGTPPLKLGRGAVIAGIGSCFAQNVLSKLADGGFEVSQNPCGIVYNAVSMSAAAARAAKGEPYKESDFFERDGLWRSWDHHGSLAESSPKLAADKANGAMASFADRLKRCSMFAATPASSVVYEYIPDGKIVANCHKVPGNMFKRRVLTVEENRAALAEMVSAVRAVNPSCLIALTLSPVRHYPGDPALNSLSKARLLCAIRDTVEASENAVYFPSYEIMSDELRDYRFYADDMAHPSALAADIIFRRFAAWIFDDDALEFLRSNLDALKRSSHIPRR